MTYQTNSSHQRERKFPPQQDVGELALHAALFKALDDTSGGMHTRRRQAESDAQRERERRQREQRKKEAQDIREQEQRRQQSIIDLVAGAQGEGLTVKLAFQSNSAVLTFPTQDAHNALVKSPWFNKMLAAVRGHFELKSRLEKPTP